jgi:predicted SnoaL-like aldol condensation-catalyzing enzyme
MTLRSITAGLLLAAAANGALAAPEAPQDNKALVTAYFRMLYQDKNVDEALNRYVSKDLVQHDPYLPDGSAAMADYYAPYFDQHPQASADIKRVIAEDDMVVVHSLWKESPEDSGQAMVDIFRVQDGKIVEHWDVIQDIPDNPANKNGMF